MKSAFLLLLIERSSVRADECIPPDSDDVWIVCSGTDCYVSCTNMTELPPFDKVKCDLTTGQPVQPFPNSCQAYDCPSIESANNPKVVCEHSKV